MSKKILGLALVLLIFLTSGTVFSQSFEVAGGFVGGYGKPVFSEDDVYTNPSTGTVGLGLQMGLLGKRFALLAEGDLAFLIPQTYFMWNGGAIIECYPFVFKDGETKIGFGVGGGFGSFLENTWYVRAEIPFLVSGFKLGINGEYYFLENGPAFRVGIMFFLREREWWSSSRNKHFSRLSQSKSRRNRSTYQSSKALCALCDLCAFVREFFRASVRGSLLIFR